jgi:transcriptional regulator with XRE-family HTH domain
VLVQQTKAEARTMPDATGYFAEKLKALRERKGVSQYALAKLTGLSKQGLSRLELGEREPTWTTVQLLSLALDVDCAAFADPALALPEPEPSRPRGRPRTLDVKADSRRRTRS